MAFAARYPFQPERLEHKHFFVRFAAELFRAANDPAVGAGHNDNAAISMYHRGTLVMLASLARGAIVEFGPYIGGTTVALARGARAVGNRVSSLRRAGAMTTPRFQRQIFWPIYT